MIKTLRITSIIAAVLAAGLFVFPAIFGFRSDKEVEEFLNLPSVVEKFRQAKGDRYKGGEGEISPLVKYAQAFGLYLDPPRPLKTKKTAKRSKTPSGPDPPPPPPPPVSVKFKVIATSFSASRPELSLALIDAPGKGRHWVRQGSVVSHLAIEQIKDGLVVVSGAKGTFEIPAEARPRQRSLLAGSSPVSMGPSSTTRSEPVAALDSGGVESVAGTDAGITRSELEGMSPEEQAAYAERIFAELAAMMAERPPDESAKTDSGYGDESPGAIVPDVEAMRITGKEAKKLDRLGRELKGADEDVEQDPNRPKSRKVDKPSKKSWKARKPPTSRPKGRTSSKRRSSSKRRTSSKEQTEKRDQQ